MAYVAVVKALYEYLAQDAETELSLEEDQIVYVIEKEDDEWVSFAIRWGAHADQA